MAQKFTKVAELMAAMKDGLAERTFPHLLTSLAAACKGMLVPELSQVAAKSGGTPPQVAMSVTLVPPPGSSTVSVKFNASASPQAGEKSTDEAAAYGTAFRRLHKDRLGSKSLVLKLLASVGVS